jgi:hypothetical protein
MRERAALLIGIVELDPAMLARRLDRQPGKIAGKPPSQRIGEEVDPMVLLGRPQHDLLEHAREPVLAIDLGDRLDLRADGVVGLVLQKIGGRPVDVEQHCPDRQREDQNVDGGKTEGRGADEAEIGI